MINNAGVFVGKAFTEYTAADFDLMIGVNLAGFVHTTQRALAYMTRGGHVIQISTSLVDNPDQANPSVLASLTKGGLAAATRAWQPVTDRPCPARPTRGRSEGRAVAIPSCHLQF